MSAATFLCCQNMTPKSIPYTKLTYLVGVAFLGSLLWSGTFRDGLLDFFILFLFFCFLVSFIMSLVLAISRRTRDAFYRIAINLAVVLLLFPTLNLGGYLRDRIFLSRLPRFQEATDLLIKNEKAKTDGERFSILVPLPASYSNLNVKNRVEIGSTNENFTVRYFNRDSSALGHSGYMYRSDDSAAGLEKQYPKTGYTRVAPHWFYFVD
jgi:hypothetical protein